MSIRTFLKPLSFLPALLLMYMIYSFSAQEADVSSAVSYKASEVIVIAADRVLDLNLESWQVANYASRLEGRVRKLAHMGEYFLLAIAVSFPLYVYGMHGILLMLVAGFICLAYAAGDEYHQSFVSGRSAQLRDVGIDGIGVVLGIIVTRIIGFAGRKTIFRPRRRDSSRPSARQRRAQLRQEQRIREEREREDYERRVAARRADRAARKNEQNNAAHKDRDYRGQEDRYEVNDRYGDRYDEQYTDRYDPRYNERYDDRYESRYDERCADRYDKRARYDERHDDRYDDDYYFDEPSSDELSDDMPLSHLLHGESRRRN